MEEKKEEKGKGGREEGKQKRRRKIHGSFVDSPYLESVFPSLAAAGKNGGIKIHSLLMGSWEAFG